MSHKPTQTKIIQFTLIPEFSWWKTADGKRLLCVIEKHGRGQGAAYTNTHVCLVERGLEEKKQVDYALFARQVSEGKLIRVYYSDVDVRDELLTYPRTIYAASV